MEKHYPVIGYKVEILNMNADFPRILPGTLAAAGSDGWDLFQTIENDGKLILIFKRGA